MPAALLIAAKDLRQRLRDRSALVIGLVAPLVIAALMSVAFAGLDTFHFTLGVVDAGGGPLAGELVGTLRQPDLRGVVTVRPLSTRRAAAAAVRAGAVQAALVVPPGFSSAIVTAHPLGLTTLTDVNQPVAGDIAAAIATSFVAQLNADRLSVAAAVAAGARSTLASLVRAAAGLRIPEQVVQRPVGAHVLKVVSYYSPAMAIFFLFFTIGYTARSFFVDRGLGMVERMRAAPVRPVEILLGKVLSVFVFGLASLAVIGLVTTVAFGASWGDPVAAGAVCVAMAVSVVCLTALVIGLARTQRQAEGISSVVIFGLALLGGNFIFLSGEPPVMRHIALFTPNGWALRAFTDLSTVGGGLRTVAVPVLAILAFSAVVGAVAAALARRAVTA